MAKNMTLTQIKTRLNRLYPALNAFELRTGQVLFAGALYGTDVNVIAKYTGLTSTYIQGVLDKAVNVGIIKSGRFAHLTLWKNRAYGPMVFYSDVQTVLGNVIPISGATGALFGASAGGSAKRARAA